MARNADTVKRHIDSLAGRFRLLQDERSIYSKWLDLVHRYDVSGRSTHDCRLVAAMSRHRISHLLTFNVKHFKRFAEITVIHPADAGDLTPLN